MKEIAGSHRRNQIGTDPEVCICSAYQMQGQKKPLLVVGERHHDILGALHSWSIPHTLATDGFLTNRGRFVDRREGLELQLEAGIPSARDGGYHLSLGELFSEDLY